MAEREALAALAVVGTAAVTPARLAALGAVPDPEASLASLQARGLVVEDERGRYAVPPMLLDRLRAGWDLADRAETLLRRLVAIAEDGALTVDDLDAVLGVSEWAVDASQLRQALRVVRGARACVDVVGRYREWASLLHRAVEVARRLDDRESEAWALEQLGAAAAAAGATDDGEALLRQARRLRRDLRLESEGGGLRRLLWRAADPVGTGARVATRGAALAAVAAAGVAVGLVVLPNDAPPASAATFTFVETIVGTETVLSTTTVVTTRTIRTGRSRALFTTGAATTVTVPTFLTTTIGARTVTVTTTETVPTTVLVPTTVTVAPPAPPP